MFALPAIVALAMLLRFYGAGSQLWFDEIETLVHAVRLPFGTLATHFPSNNDHVFYSELAHLCIKLGGDTPLMLRLPAVMFGILSIPLIYSFGQTVTSRFEAIAAVLMATLSYHHVWFSQNARGYTILLCVALLSTQALVTGLRNHQRWPFVLFGVVTALGAYTHLTMVLVAVGQTLVVGAHLRANRRQVPAADWARVGAGFALAALLTVLLYMPMLGDLAGFFGNSATTPKAATAGWALLELTRGTGSVLVLTVGLTVFVVGAVSYAHQSPLTAGLMLVPGALVYAVSAAMQRPTFPRFFFFMAGFVLLVLVRGVCVITAFTVQRLAPRLARHAVELPYLAVSAMAAMLLVDLPRAYSLPKQDYLGALAFVEAQAAPGDRIMFGENGTAFPGQHYFNKPWTALESAADLQAARATQTVWVLHTFERYLALRDPARLALLKRDCIEVQKFEGTLADGNIRVSRCPKLS